jgi:hypothetical protein
VEAGAVYAGAAYCGAPAAHPWSNAMASVMVRTRAAMTSARLFALMFNALAFSSRPNC